LNPIRLQRNEQSILNRPNHSLEEWPS
jgi:hypothetical protein